MNAYRGSKEISPFIRTLSCRWRWAVNFTSWPLYPRKEFRYLLNMKLSGPQSRSGRFGEKTISSSGRYSNSGPSSPQPSSYTDYVIPALFTKNKMLFLMNMPKYFIFRIKAFVVRSFFFAPKNALFFTEVPRKFGFSHKGSTDVKTLNTCGLNWTHVLGSLI